MSEENSASVGETATAVSRIVHWTNRPAARRMKEVGLSLTD
jgi:hypothetical protein